MSEDRVNLRLKVIVLLTFIFLFSLIAQSVALIIVDYRLENRQKILSARSHILKLANHFAAMDAKEIELVERRSSPRLSGLPVWSKMAECVYLFIPNTVSVVEGDCGISTFVSYSLKKTYDKGEYTLDYQRSKGSPNSNRDRDRQEIVVQSVPIKKDNQIIGAIAVTSLASDLNDELIKIGFGFVVINIFVFVTIAFFRFDRLFVRPVNRLLDISRKFTDGQEFQVLSTQTKGPFRVLASSLQSMLNKIKEDNTALRTHVSELKILNKELLENKKQIVKSEKLASVGRLSAGFAHEIGNPLSIVQGYVELLKRDNIDNSDRKNFASKAQIELDRINKLILEMLDFSKPAESNEISVNLNEMVLEVIDLLRVEKRVKSCQIYHQLLDHGPIVLIEKDSLKQVIMNCVLNAADSYKDSKDPDRPIHIVVYRNDSEVDTYYSISIEDKGEGIDEETLSLVFDPFFTTKEPGEGTGLGLFVSHMLMERMGGQIRVQPGKKLGTRVEIEFPISGS